MTGPTSALSEARELSGGIVIWIFVAIELLTFGLFFIGFASARRADPASFAAGQATLHPLLGALNTCVLLTGGWLAARAVVANRSDDHRTTGTCLWGAALSGGVFMGIKLHEYGGVFAAGISLSTSTFWFYYLFVTGLHFLHVLAGVAFLAPTALRARRGEYGSSRTATVAVFWHLVDLIWILLFPLFYLAR